MPVRYLLYTSRLVDPPGPGAVPTIIRTSRTNNAKRGVTGALLFDGERFCQYLEGDAEEVDRTFAVIDADGRHSDVAVLADGFADARRFDKWSMAYVFGSTCGLIEAIESQPVTRVVDAFAQALTRCDIDA